MNINNISDFEYKLDKALEILDNYIDNIDNYMKDKESQEEILHIMKKKINEIITDDEIKENCDKLVNSNTNTFSYCWGSRKNIARNNIILEKKKYISIKKNILNNKIKEYGIKTNLFDVNVDDIYNNSAYCYKCSNYIQDKTCYKCERCNITFHEQCLKANEDCPNCNKHIPRIPRMNFKKMDTIIEETEDNIKNGSGKLNVYKNKKKTRTKKTKKKKNSYKKSKKKYK
jgi:hypothetical protein